MITAVFVNKQNNDCSLCDSHVGRRSLVCACRCRVSDRACRDSRIACHDGRNNGPRPAPHHNVRVAPRRSGHRAGSHSPAGRHDSRCDGPRCDAGSDDPHLSDSRLSDSRLSDSLFDNRLFDNRLFGNRLCDSPRVDSPRVDSRLCGPPAARLCAGGPHGRRGGARGSFWRRGT